MKIGVTGASGFIGKRIMEMGLDKGYEMVAFVRTPSKLGNDLQKKVKIFTGDIANKESLKDFVTYCDVIIHTAATVSDWAPRKEYQKTSIDGTKYVLDYMVGTNKKIVLASSVAVYTSHIANGLCTGDLPFTPPYGNYSWAKQEQEKLVVQYGKEQNVKYAIIRPGNIFGPFCPSWVHDYIAAMKQGPMLINGGKQKSLTYVDNVSDMFLLAATNAKSDGQIYNGTDDQEITWEEYGNAIAKTLNMPKPKALNLGLAKVVSRVVPAIYSLIGSKKRPPLTQEALNFVAYDYNMPYTNAQKDLGFRPIVHRDEALKRTMNYISLHAAEF